MHTYSLFYIYIPSRKYSTFCPSSLVFFPDPRWLEMRGLRYGGFFSNFSHCCISSTLSVSPSKFLWCGLWDPFVSPRFVLLTFYFLSHRFNSIVFLLWVLSKFVDFVFYSPVQFSTVSYLQGSSSTEVFTLVVRFSISNQFFLNSDFFPFLSARSSVMILMLFKFLLIWIRTWMFKLLSLSYSKSISDYSRSSLLLNCMVFS